MYYYIYILLPRLQLMTLVSTLNKIQSILKIFRRNTHFHQDYENTLSYKSQAMLLMGFTHPYPWYIVETCLVGRQPNTDLYSKYVT